MHGSRDIQVWIFEPWDWVYFQALSSWARAKTFQKLVQTPFFMVLSTRIPVLRKFRSKNLQKILFGEGQVQDPIPAFSGIESKIPAILLQLILKFSDLVVQKWRKNREQTDGRMDGQKNDFNRVHFLKKYSNYRDYFSIWNIIELAGVR
jgi:hypothetical protein